jgi:hypothetical protein
MRHADRARTNPACRQTEKTVIPLLALGAAIAFFTMLSSGVNAADLAFPPRVVGQPQYGLAPSPAIPPPQVIIIPGPTAPPPYNGAMLPPPVVGSPPYGLAPRVAPRVYAERRSACPLAWRCGDRGCGWQPGCAPPLERYPGGPQVYSGPGGAPAPDQYPGQYELLDPQVYSGPGSPPVPDHYPGQYGSSGPQVYSGAAGPPAPDQYPGQYELLGPRCTPVLPPHQLQTSILASTPAPAATHPKTAIPADTPHKCIEVQLVPIGVILSTARKRGPRCRHHICFAGDREARRQDRICRGLTSAQRAQVSRWAGGSLVCWATSSRIAWRTGKIWLRGRQSGAPVVFLHFFEGTV